MENYVLKRAIEYDGNVITEINMDLDSLSVRDLELAEREAKAFYSKGEEFNLPETNKKYLAAVAARAASVHIDLIRALFASDYTRITSRVMGFLMGDSQEESEVAEDLEIQSPVLKKSNSALMESLKA